VNQVLTKGIDEKFCSECGAIIKAKAEICPKCGVRQMPPPAQAASSDSLARVSPSGRSRLAAALFAILLGTFGIHKFYLGRIGWGVVYLLFFWTFIPTLLGLVEGIVYLVMSDKDFDTKYG